MKYTLVLSSCTWLYHAICHWSSLGLTCFVYRPLPCPVNSVCRLWPVWPSTCLSFWIVLPAFIKTFFCFSCNCLPLHYVTDTLRNFSFALHHSQEICCCTWAFTVSWGVKMRLDEVLLNPFLIHYQKNERTFRRILVDLHRSGNWCTQLRKWLSTD